MKTLLAQIHLIFTLDCEQSTRLVSESLDRNLSLSERLAVRLHYIGCWSCRRFRRHLDFIRESMKRFDANDEASEGLSNEAKKRIRNALDRPGP